MVDKNEPINPYHFVKKCISGKWKMVILHKIHTEGYIRFNQTRNRLQISEKVLSTQLKELIDDGLIERKVYSKVPLKSKYTLTAEGEVLAIEIKKLYLWAKDRV